MKTEIVASELSELLGNRCSVDYIRRFTYGHDMGVLPDFVKKFIETVPDIVVQPLNEDEIVSIIQIAEKYEMPLVPRGQASAGYGGAVPASAGIVLDMTRMTGLVDVDHQHKQATALPGSILLDLNDKLQNLGYMLPVMPSSAPAATIGGFVCQGGSGIGSCRYGFMLENLVSVRMALSDGTVREFSGEELEYVYGLEGTTGIVTSVTFDIIPLAKMHYGVYGFDSILEAQNFVDQVNAFDPWHVNIKPSNLMSLKNKLIDTGISDHWAVLVAAEHLYDINETAILANAYIYDKAVVEKEWEERFYPLRAKKLGPSIIPVDVIIPQDKFVEFNEQVVSKYDSSFYYEATAIHHDKYVIVGFFLADERRDDFAMSYANSLIVNEIARKIDGRVYASGMYFTEDSDEIFGKDKLKGIYAFKSEVDPKGIMNPGKVFPSSLDENSPSKTLAKSISKAKSVSGIGSAFGKALSLDKRKKVLTDLPNEMEESAFACASCGFCRSKCTVFLPDAWEDNSPRGKWYLIREYAKGNLDFDVPMVHKLNICTTCKRCEQTCEVSLNMGTEYLCVKPYFKSHGFVNSGLSALRENVLNTGNFWGADVEQLDWRSSDLEFSTDGEIGIWPGCWSETISKNAPQNVVRLLNAAGIKPVDLTNYGTDICCGFYLYLGGYEEDFEKRVVNNIKRLNDLGVRKVITPCPACLATFVGLYPAVASKYELDFDIEFIHSIVLLEDLVSKGELNLADGLEQNVKVTYHDPCHLGRWFEVYEQPRNFIKSIPGVQFEDMKHNRDDSLCCGLVNAFYELNSVPISGMNRVEEADQVDADYILTACAGCGVQVNNMCVAAQTHARQLDITDLAAQAMGFEVYDSNEAAAAYFEAAVSLLSTSTTVEE